MPDSVVSDEAVGLGLASGVAVSLFFSQAASRPTVTMMQMYFFMGLVVVDKCVWVNPNLG